MYRSGLPCMECKGTITSPDLPGNEKKFKIKLNSLSSMDFMILQTLIHRIIYVFMMKGPQLSSCHFCWVEEWSTESSFTSVVGK